MASDGDGALLAHIETFVDPGLSSSEHDTSCSVLIDFIIRKKTSLPQIVKEMENYLTTTDVAIRARGILLLGEIWKQLDKYPVEDMVIHTFANFFTARIEDWHALRGALLGSLALLKRRKNVGSVNEEDAKLLAESALQNLEVQSLSQADRMLCLEFFEVLLLHHHNVVLSLGTSFAESVCAAIEGEKDPRCLLIAFHVVELVMKLIPDLNGDLGDLSEDIFGIISCYFPISFNPVPDDKRGIAREDLSVALMHSFASSTLFADSCIQLFLEKLSSSLRTAKLDSLKFLGFCCLRYGSETLKKHAAAIWASLKQELFVSQTLEVMNMKKTDQQIITEALECFKACITASQEGNQGAAELGETNSFLHMVLQDPFLDDSLKCLPVFLVCTDEDNDNLMKIKHEHSLSDNTSLVVERTVATITQTSPILAAAVKASNLSCFSVLSLLLKRILEFMKLPGSLQEMDILTFSRGNMSHPSLCFIEPTAVAVLGLLGMIIEAAADVAENNYMMENTVTSNDSSMAPLQHYFTQLVMMFSWIIVAGLQKSKIETSTSHEKIWHMGVAGMEAVASFPPQVAGITENHYPFILSFLTWIILEKSQARALWDRAIEAVSCICGKEQKFSSARFGHGKTDSLIVSLINNLSDNQTNLSIDHNLRALAAICNQKSGISSIVVKRITELIHEKLEPPSAARCDNVEPISMLLHGLLEHILPCCGNTIPENKAMFELAVGIWSGFKNFSLAHSLQNIEILEGSMGVFRTSVCKCDEESQQALISIILEYSIQCKDICTIGLFACLVISLRSSIQIPRKQAVLFKLLETAVLPSCNRIADILSNAIGSLLNKWVDHSAEESLTNGGTFSLAEAINMILKGEWIPKDDFILLNGHVSSAESSENSELYVKVRCIKLLAAISKGLAMKGHIMVAEFATLLLRLVVCQSCPSNIENDTLLYFIWPKEEELSVIGNAAAEGLGFIVKGQGTFLNKDHHTIIKPLYQQRFFLSMLSLLTQTIKQADTNGRVRLYYAFGNIISGIPTSVLITEAGKVLPLLLQSMSALCHENMQSDILLSILLVLSALLVDRNGAEVCSDHLPTIVNNLLMLVHYPFSMIVRETSLLCLGAVVALPHARVFPLRKQVEKALLDALDDPKRGVRREAIRCRRAWAAITR